jgi:hypothetical protein
MDNVTILWTGVAATPTIISLILLSFISALFLLWGLQIFKVKGRNYWYALLVVIVVNAINYILNLLLGTMNATALTIIEIIIWWFVVCSMINTKYNIGWMKATYVWIVWGILHYIASVIFVWFIAALIASWFV